MRGKNNNLTCTEASAMLALSITYQPENLRAVVDRVRNPTMTSRVQE